VGIVTELYYTYGAKDLPYAASFVINVQGTRRRCVCCLDVNEWTMHA